MEYNKSDLDYFCSSELLHSSVIPSAQVKSIYTWWDVSRYSVIVCQHLEVNNVIESRFLNYLDDD